MFIIREWRGLKLNAKEAIYSKAHQRDTMHSPRSSASARTGSTRMATVVKASSFPLFFVRFVATVQQRHRICIVSDFVHPSIGGVETHTASLALALAARGHKVGAVWISSCCVSLSCFHIHSSFNRLFL